MVLVLTYCSSEWLLCDIKNKSCQFEKEPLKCDRQQNMFLLLIFQQKEAKSVFLAFTTRDNCKK